MSQTTVSKAILNHSYITQKEGVCRGKPRIKVAQIAIEYDFMGLTADEIIQAHPHLNLTQLHDALCYYYDNIEEINSDIREGKQFVGEMKKRYPSISEKKRRCHSCQESLC